jgi:hypothetical protein
VREGSIRTFLSCDHAYDSFIWTTQLEFYGSFLAFALAIAMTCCATHRAV